jgi:peroxiredoxin
MKILRWLGMGVLTLMLSLPVYGQKNGYQIKVKVTGLRDSLCYLANYFGDKQYLRDSANADQQGNLVFKGTEPLKGGIYMIVLPGQKYFEVIVDKEQHFSLETAPEDYVQNMKITGSADNVRFYDYLKFIASKSREIEPLKHQYEAVKDDPARSEAVRKQMSAIDSAVLNYRSRLQTEHPEFLLSKVLKATDEIKIPDFPLNPDGTRDSIAQFHYYKQHFFDNIDLTDDRLLYTPVFHPKLEQYFKNLTIQMPDSIIKEADKIISQLKPGSEMFKYIVWWITNKYETSNIMGMDAVFVHMAENYYSKEKAFWVDEAQLFKIKDRAKVLKPILIGKKVKNLVLTDTLGMTRALYDIKAKYTVLYFWDPDCGHCKKATPKLKEYYDEVKAKGVQVYAVCTEVEMEKWKDFIREYKLNWINVADPKLQNNFRYEFDLSTTPQIFLLDENKTIIAKRIEVETLREILDRYLN